jgi:hypothetical protein
VYSVCVEGHEESAILSNTSKRVLPFLVADSDPVVRHILRSASRFQETVGDGGFRFLVFALYLKEIMDGVDLDYRRVAAHALQRASRWCQRWLRQYCLIRIRWDSASRLLAVVRSCMGKPLVRASMRSSELERLCILVLRAFTSNAGDDEESVPPTVSILSVVAAGDSFLAEGVIVDRAPCSASAQELPFPSKVALFDAALDTLPVLPGVIHSQAAESTDAVFVDALVDSLSAARVGLVLCQRGIGAPLARRLAAVGIASVERLSIRHMDAVIRLTGAQPAGSPFAAPSAACLGRVAFMRRILVGGRTQTLLGAVSDRPAATLVLCGADERALEETEAAVRSALAVLRGMLADPWAHPGAGATEVLAAAAVRRRAAEWRLRRSRDGTGSRARIDAAVGADRCVLLVALFPPSAVGTSARVHEAFACALEKVAASLSPPVSVSHSLIIDALRTANGLASDGQRMRRPTDQDHDASTHIYGWDPVRGRARCVACLPAQTTGLPAHDTHVGSDCDAGDSADGLAAGPLLGREDPRPVGMQGATASLLEPAAVLRGYIASAAETAAALATVGAVLVEPGAQLERK